MVTSLGNVLQGVCYCGCTRCNCQTGYTRSGSGPRLPGPGLGDDGLVEERLDAYRRQPTPEDIDAEAWDALVEVTDGRWRDEQER